MRSIRPAAQNQEMNAAASILLRKSIAGGSKRPGSCGVGAMNADVTPRRHIYCQNLLPQDEISGALPASASLVMNIPVCLHPKIVAGVTPLGEGGVRASERG